MGNFLVRWYENRFVLELRSRQNTRSKSRNNAFFSKLNKKQLIPVLFFQIFSFGPIPFFLHKNNFMLRTTDSLVFFLLVSSFPASSLYYDVQKHYSILHLTDFSHVFLWPFALKPFISPRLKKVC
jgi:hypothetical protein